MEEGNEYPISLILHGCSLARYLESNLSNLAAQHNPHIISEKCDEIVGVFTMARHQLNSLQLTPVVVDHPTATSREMAAIGSVEQQQRQRQPQAGKGKELVGEEPDESSMMNVDSEEQEPQQRNPRRSSIRKEDQAADRRVVRVPVPQIGNTEVPPEDGYTWRKYGQKEILGAKHPRSYYRCTHQKLYNCPAKKQVQRLDDDPYTFEILYRGDHTCHMSSTAPSVPPPPSQTIHQPITVTATSSSLNQWLLKNFPAGSSNEGSSLGFEPQQQQQQQQIFHVNSSNNNILGNYNNALAAPSTVGSHHQEREAVDLLNFPFMDLADAMFNSGSSSSNSMEFIFPPADNHKWDGPKDAKD